MFPCVPAEILSDIAAQYSFTVGFTPEPDTIHSIPRNTTCREIIGYIAGLNGGAAKFDRNGVLQLKKLQSCDFTLTRGGYTELSLKADKMEIRAVEFVNDENIFSEGKGTKLTTYRQFNPLSDAKSVKRVFDEWNGFSYHGLTVKMQGLPFLESGDSILVQDDFDDTVYRALISDYTLEYDGGLKGTLISKSKNPIDDYEEPMTQERLMQSLSESLRIRYHNYENDKKITISGTNQSISIASINFELEVKAFAVFNAHFTVKATADCILTLHYHINNEKTGQTPQMSLTADKPSGICLYNCFENQRAGKNTLTVTASVSGGSAVIEQGELIASVSGQYMLGDGKQQLPEINASESFGTYGIRAMDFSGQPFKESISYLANILPISVTRFSAGEVMGKYTVNQMCFSTLITNQPDEPE